MGNPDSRGYTSGAEPVEPRRFFSLDEVREGFVWSGSDKYPERTEEEAWPHLEAWLSGNEYVNEEELANMGFARKESVEE